MIGRWPWYTWYVSGGFVIGAVASLLAYLTLKPDVSLGLLIAIQVLAGVGFGLFMQNILVIVQVSIPIADVAITIPTVWFWGRLGGVIGLAVMNAVVMGTFRPQAIAILGTNATAVLESTVAIQSLPSAEKVLVVDAYAGSIRNVFLMAFALGVLGAVVGLFITGRVFRWRWRR